MASRNCSDQYPSDLTDAEWKRVKPILDRFQFVEHDPREILNAIFYLLKGGVQWRMIPDGFPPWQTVYGSCQLGAEQSWPAVLKQYAMACSKKQLLSEEECYEYLKRSLHPEGLSCPNGHELPDGQAPYDRRREPIVDYRCRECGAVFNIFTNTVWSKTHYDPSTIVMLLRGFAKGMPTKWLTDEMGLANPSVLDRRHRIQSAVQRGERVGLPGEAPEGGLPDPEVEADEMYQNAGKKAIRTAIRMILPARGQTSSADEGPTRTTGLPSQAWLGAKRGGSASRSAPTRRKRLSRR